ncbi:flippase [Patescibacteria group bacterium]|nr:flippase [Patescibacteria group bacterium]MBU0963430.1 flippase [Patescibacteria group bacterium]
MNNLLFKGAAYLTFANLIFMGSGYIIQILIGRFFDPALYGTFGIVIYLINLLNTILTSGFFQGISRSIAEKETAAKTILRKSLKIEIILTPIIALIYYGLADLISRGFGDPQMAYYIRLSALLIPLYGIRTVYIGVLNGLKRFNKQSLIAIIAAISKLVLVVIFLLMGLDLDAILLAYFLAALVSLITAMSFTKIKNGLDHFPGKKLFNTTITISFYAFGFPLLMSIDLFLVKYFSNNQDSAGYYNSATTLSRFLYIILAGFVISLLPIISGYYYKNLIEKVRENIKQAIRLSLIILGPLTIIASLTAGNLIPLIFSDKYNPAITSFSILVFGMSLLALTRVMMTIIISIGQQKMSLYLTIMLILASIAANLLLIPKYGINGAAWATTFVGVIGLLFSYIYVWKKINKITNWISIIKIIIASLVVGIVCKVLITELDFSNFKILALYSILVLIYLITLVMFKEFSKNDILILRNFFTGKNINKKTDI